MSVKAGIYKHFKGNLYEVIGIATHSETLEKQVVYRPLYGDRELWVRPLNMFEGTVVHDDATVARFQFIEATGG
jgi:hypothetical protein